MSTAIDNDPRLEGLRIASDDPTPDLLARYYTIRERNGMVIASGLTAQQVTMLLNRMRTVQVLP
jgi:hypothetical protein